MLRFIIGTSGSYKTNLIREMLYKLASSGNDKLMLVIPEQFSFESERNILQLMGDKLASKIKIVSFTWLANLVFNEIGGVSGIKLNESGSKILMNEAINKVKDKITLYNSTDNYTELVDLMLEYLAELKSCAVEVDYLEEKATKLKDGNILKDKILQTSLIIETYEALIKNKYINPLDDLNRLEEALINNKNIFEGYSIFFDSFDGFTQQELKVIKQLMTDKNDLVFSICSDANYKQDDGIGLFYKTKNMMHKILKIAEQNNIKVEPNIYLNKNKRTKCEDLILLEKNIFRNKKVELHNDYGNIKMYNASDIYDEVNYIAATICEYIINKGYRYRDFAVITRNPDEYHGIIDTVFEKYDIPFFMDLPQNIENKPIMNLVITIFEIIHTSFGSDEIFRFLKTGLAGLNEEEIAILENYTLLWNINGKEWFNEFTDHPRGFKKTKTLDDEKQLKIINSLRIRIVEPILKFRELIKNVTGEEITKQLFLLLTKLNVQNSLTKMVNKLNENNEYSLANEQIKLWDLLMNILDQCALTISKQKITSHRYLELLKLAINSSDISSIPMGLDNVIIGSVERTRVENPKIIFLIGAIEGQFPKVPSNKGLFNDLERKKIREMGVNIFDTDQNIASGEIFLAYRAIVSPSEKLYVSWYNADIKGNVKYHSSIVSEIKKCFPNILIKNKFTVNQNNNIWAKKPAFENVSKLWNTNTKFSNTLKKYFIQNNEYKNKINSLNRVKIGTQIKFNDPKKASIFFGNDMKISTTQIEKFYLCKFQYFCKYSLKAKERKPAVFDRLEYGNTIHFLLENIFKLYKPEELANMEYSKVNKIVEEILNNYVNLKLGGFKNKTHRFKYLFNMLIKTSCSLVIYVAKGIITSGFKPVDYELSIGKDIKPIIMMLKNGTKIRIEGNIDRVDLMKINGKSYIRVVDYKTGVKEFKISDIIYGLNMQMLVYLNTIWKNGNERYGDIEPAGILYMPAKVPIVEVNRNEDFEKITLKKQKALKMNGLILDDDEVLKAMEKEAKGIYNKLKKSGQTTNESIINLQQMKLIANKIENLIINMAESLQNGEISAVPKTGEYEACSWCAYRCVCCYEKSNKNIKVYKFNKKDTIIKLSEEGDSI